MIGILIPGINPINTKTLIIPIMEKLENNKFIMFPSTQMYYITNNQKDSLNFILTTTYEFI